MSAAGMIIVSMPVARFGGSDVFTPGVENGNPHNVYFIGGGGTPVSNLLVMKRL